MTWTFSYGVMPMILTITQAGLARETDALTSGAMPKFSQLHVGDGVPNPSPFTTTAMVNSRYQTDVLVVERLSPGAVKFHASVPAEVELNIREVGLFLEDGTLYAYADYSQGTGQSFFKAAGFAFSFFVLLTREQLPDLVFTYQPVDTAAIATTIVQDASAAIDTQIQGYLAGIISLLSALASDMVDVKKSISKAPV